MEGIGALNNTELIHCKHAKTDGGGDNRWKNFDSLTFDGTSGKFGGGIRVLNENAQQVGQSRLLYGFF